MSSRSHEQHPPRDDAPAQEADALAVVEKELHRKGRGRRIVEASVSLAVVGVIFAFVIPAVSNAHYSEIWREISRLSWAQVGFLTGLWITSMLLYTGVLTNTLPGLTHPQALTVNFAGSAVSNVVPFGGAVGVGATYGIEMSWGFRVSSITLSILVSGVWNVFTKLGLPVLALILLLIKGSATGHLLVPTLLGLLVLSAAVVVLALIMRSEGLAEKVGVVGQRVVTPVARWTRRPTTPDVATAALDFRHRSIGLLRTRWWRLTLWMLAYNTGQFLLLLAQERNHCAHIHGSLGCYPGGRLLRLRSMNKRCRQGQQHDKGQGEFHADRIYRNRASDNSAAPVL